MVEIAKDSIELNGLSKKQSSSCFCVSLHNDAPHELCCRDEVRKETAQEILQKLYRRTRNYHGNRCLLTSKDVIDIAQLYGIGVAELE